MDTIPEPETQPRDCDACVAYECKVKLPAEFHGKYYDWNSMEWSDGALCILHYLDAAKDAAKCAAAVKRKMQAADFKFRDVLFCGVARFQGQIEKADFRGARFRDGADFSRATFSGAACFTSATFSGPAVFTGATFRGQANFFCAIFTGAAFFAGGIFSGIADFTEVTFSGPAYFSSRVFNGEALFDELAKERNERGGRTDDKVELDFSSAKFDQPEKILFRNLNLREARFLHADVRSVRFTNIIWPPELLDERTATEKDYPHVEVLCRQLRQNYEEQRNYPDAGLFYHGEMEMRRKQMPRWRRDLLSLPALYHVSSGYGQDYVQASKMTVLLMILFTLCHMWAGLRLESGVQGDFPSNVSWAVSSVRGWFSNFLYGGLHTLQVLTFSRNRTFAPLNWKGELLIVLQTIILPLQIALFALAVRRKFQR